MLLRIPAHRATALGAMFRAAAAGEGRAAVVQGSLEGAPRDAEEAGLEVLRTRGRAGARPFAAAVELLAPAVAQLGPEARRSAFGGAASLAEGLFAPDGEQRPPAASDFAIVHGLYWLTARLADRRPLALLVEDAGRADEPSLRLCAYLAQRIDELPVVLVLA